jgi:hypothetical protein
MGKKENSGGVDLNHRPPGYEPKSHTGKGRTIEARFTSPPHDTSSKVLYL